MASDTVKITLTETQRVFAYKRSSFVSGGVDGSPYSNLRFLWTDEAREKWKSGTDVLAETVEASVTAPMSSSSYTYVMFCRFRNLRVNLF